MTWGREGEDKRYHDPPVRPEDSVSKEQNGDRVAPTGTDYAVVLVDALAERQGNVIVAGISGTGTFGASVFVCEKAELFELPVNERRYVRAFLVEIGLEVRSGMFWPAKARVRQHWTKGTNEFVPARDTDFFELHSMQT